MDEGKDSVEIVGEAPVWLFLKFYMENIVHLHILLRDVKCLEEIHYLLIRYI